MKYRGIIILLLCWFCLAACGRAGRDPELGIGGYLYPAQQLSPEGEDIWWRNMKVQGETLYFVDTGSLCSLPIGETMNTADRKVLTGGSSVADYAIGPDGAIYYVTQTAADWGTRSAGCTIKRQGDAGSKGWNLVLKEAKLSGMLEGCLATDRDGRLFLLSEGELLLFGGDGRQLGSLSTEGYRFSGGTEYLVNGPEGRIYYVASRLPFSFEEQAVYEILGGDNPRLEKAAGAPGRLYGSEYGLISAGEDGILYRYLAESAEWEPVLRWTDSGIDTPSAVAQISEDKFIVSSSELKAAAMDYGSKELISLLTRTLVSELPKKEVLTLAAVYPSSELKTWVTKFNQENEKYQVVIEQYGLEDVEMRLNSRLVSTSPPDIVNLARLDVINYANRQVFEDLTPYLESSAALDRENYFEEILEAYTIGGRLVCIPANFYISVVLGRASQVGEEAGWTMAEVMKLWEVFPDKKLYNVILTEFMLKQLCGKYICSQYIDLETGECSFDSAEFREFMEWIKYYEEKNASGSKNAVGDWSEDCLLYIEYLYTLSDFARSEWLAGEKITAIGRPTADGSPSLGVGVNDALSISARSRHKEGAWAFIEYVLSQEQGDLGFSSRKDVFLQKLEKEMTPDYLKTEDGEIMVYGDGVRDETGNIIPAGSPRIRPRAYVTDPVTGQSHVLYDSMSREQADELLEIVSLLDFTSQGGMEDKVLDIILEEAAGYLNGERALEDVTGNIQNRVQNLLQEVL
ncbi:MAG: extracellular solute-binding protein [Lachnospiraceae bacterium]|nr:extracellular solute-binding protein [Lachnospiraceae bacterium]